MNRDELIAKLLKVEALFHGTSIEGEKSAARSAMDRLHAQLTSHPELEEEYQFSLPDPWKRKLFLALVRKHGLKPYRHPRQRQSTVMVRLPRTDLDRTLWPEFLELSQLLATYLNEVTEDIITRGVHGDLSEAPEQPTLPFS